MSLLNDQVKKLLVEVGVKDDIELTIPPNSEMGDLSFACFGLAKDWKKSPVDCAKEIVEKIKTVETQLITSVQAIGPYVNFYLNPQELAKLLLGTNSVKPAKAGHAARIMVEFAHPNTHKPVHIGHLRNMITGESLVRILESQGYKVVRANYQGDVGMQVAKCLWGVEHSAEEFAQAKKSGVSERANFLGRAYALGAQTFEKDEQVKKEVEEYNKKIYDQDKSIKKLYTLTRKWSLDYFNEIYKRVGVRKFDRLYFESETPKRAVEIVKIGLKSGIFKASQGAVIFEGSLFGLHDRVFLNSKGLPVYEAKDQALAEIQFKEYNPVEIWHLVAKEQTEYFKVIFKALEFTLPESKNREKHLVYGWVSLKEGKMSSRTGQVILAEWLLDEAEKKIAEVMDTREIKDKSKTIKKIAIAAVKYSMLKTSIENDIVFDVNEAVSLTGDSGPYLLYIVARISSILRKVKISNFKFQISNLIEPVEKKLLLELSRFDEVMREAAEDKDPSQIAKYLFNLAQAFNNFYQICSVLQAEGETKNFRLQLVKKVKEVMVEGLELLGIDKVEEM